MKYYKLSYLISNAEGRIVSTGVTLLSSPSNKIILDFEKYGEQYFAGNGIFSILNIDIIDQETYEQLGGMIEIE